MSNSSAKIGKIQVQTVDKNGNLTQDRVACESFWQNGPAVIIFFRRFGCAFCQIASKELSSKLKPILDEHNIRLIGIGFDSAFVGPFVEDGFFHGEMFVDSNRECYNALQFKKMKYMDVIRMITSNKFRQSLTKSIQMKVVGNAKGDSLQNGGALIIDESGKVLFEYRQEEPTELPTAEEILSALGIDDSN